MFGSLESYYDAFDRILIGKRKRSQEIESLAAQSRIQGSEIADVNVKIIPFVSS